MSLWSRVHTGLAAAGNDLVRSRRAETDEVHLSAAIDWICRSQDATEDGGSAAVYNLVLGWGEPYPETTGYIIPTLFSYAASTNTPEVAERAVRMADWLCSVQADGGWFPGGTGGSGDPGVFNTGQVVFGLVKTYRETGAERYRRAARDACDWLVSEQTERGAWDRNVYNGTEHVYTTRIAWALLEAAAVLPEEASTYKAAARRNLDWAVTQQQPNGWFRQAGFNPGTTPFLHTIAYTVRGLLEGGIALEEAAFVDAARRTADELLTRHRREGVLRGAYDSAWSPSWYYCLPGNAQTALVWLRLAAETGEPAYREAARETLAFLKRRQPLEGPAPIRGGLAGSYPSFGRYMYLRYPNWGAKFLADVLMLTQDQQSVRSPARERATPEH